MVGTASCPLPPPKHRNVHQASTGHRGIVSRCSFRSCRGELEGGQGPGGVAGVVAAGGGDVAVGAEFPDGGANVAQGGHDPAAVAGAGLGDVFAEGDVADVVEGFDARSRSCSRAGLISDDDTAGTAFREDHWSRHLYDLGSRACPVLKYRSGHQIINGTSRHYAEALGMSAITRGLRYVRVEVSRSCPTSSSDSSRSLPVRPLELRREA